MFTSQYIPYLLSIELWIMHLEFTLKSHTIDRIFGIYSFFLSDAPESSKRETRNDEGHRLVTGDEHTDKFLFHIYCNILSCHM